MRNKPPMMKCGHAANATDGNGNPSCAICINIHPGAKIIDDTPPNLEGRKAQCPSCKKTRDSDMSLAFFEYRPNAELDIYYCGCRGWD